LQTPYKLSEFCGILKRGAIHEGEFGASETRGPKGFSTHHPRFVQ
jgi:hypothetical protein